MSFLLSILLLFFSISTLAAQVVDTTIAPTDVKFVSLTLSVDPAHKYIRGCVSHHFNTPKLLCDKPIEFQLADEYIIESIQNNGENLNYYRQNGHIRIYPNSFWQPLDSVTIKYCGEPPCTGLGSVNFDTHDNFPIFWTLSEPYGALDWWPCKQDISDKIDSIYIIVHCPEKYRAASNGFVVSEQVVDNQRITEWHHLYPIAYHLVAVAITNYKIYSDWIAFSNNDSLEIVNYVYPERFDQWQRRSPRIVPAFKMLCDSFGKYPFANEKYGHAQFNWKGGMEHQTMSFMHNLDLDLMIHELAHQWFGNMITCSSWRDIFLNEGFATYCELLATEKGVAQGSEVVQWRRVAINKACNKPHESIYIRNASDLNRLFDTDVVYNKGAMMLHMLRIEIGDYKFFKCLKSYVSNQRIMYGNSSADNFFEIVRIVSGRNLEWFFNQWYYGYGFPIYHIKWQQTPDGLVDVVVNQETSDSSVQFFRGKISLLLHGRYGNQTIFRLNNYYPNQHFTINPKFEVAKIELDPYCDIVTKNSDIERADVSDNHNVTVKNVQDGVKIILSDSCRFDWIILRTVKNTSMVRRERISGSRHLEINMSTMTEGKYILILEGDDYFSTIINNYHKKRRLRQ